MNAMPRVGLVLGSGSARGYAHIGVIDVLQERGYQIVGVAGSSMGALVGGLYAAGKLDEFADWATSLTQGGVLRLLDPSFTASGVLRAGKILDTVRDMLGGATIESLPIPYTAVATDLIAGRSVWLQHGPVDDAIRASIAIPGLISPHVVDGRLLADGGLLNPLPMAPIAGVNADLTIAVDLGAADGIGLAGDDGADDVDDGPGRTTEWLNRMVQGASDLFDTQAIRSLLDRPTARAVLSRFGVSDADSEPGAEAEQEPGAEPDTEPGAEPDSDPDSAPEPDDPDDGLPKLGTLAVMNRAIDIAQAALARHQLAMYPPDITIDVPRTACRALDFHRAAELIQLGRELAAAALDGRPEPAEPQG